MTKIKQYAKSYAKMAVNKKNTYASNCGAGKEGAGGFQPGNTCGGDGDGKDTPKDTGGGDKPKGAGEGGITPEQQSQLAEDAMSELNPTDRQMAESEIRELQNYSFDSKSDVQEYLDGQYGSPGEGVSPEITDAIWEGIGGERTQGGWVGKDRPAPSADTGAGEGGGIWWGGNYAELNIPQEAVDDIAQSGPNDEAVDSWHGDIDFSNISDEQLKNELEQHDLSENMMSSRENMEKALLWMSAHDISEDPDMYAPDTGAGEGGGATDAEWDETMEHWGDIDVKEREAIDELIMPNLQEDGTIHPDDVGGIMSSIEATGISEERAEDLILSNAEISDTGAVEVDHLVDMATGEYDSKEELRNDLEVALIGHGAEPDTDEDTVTDQELDAVWDKLQADTGAGEGRPNFADMTNEQFADHLKNASDEEFEEIRNDITESYGIFDQDDRDMVESIAKERQAGAGEGVEAEPPLSPFEQEVARIEKERAGEERADGKSWGSSSEQRVWIGSEGAYSQGDLVGEWVDATDVVEATEQLTKKWQEQGYGDEWAVMDSEGVPDSLHHDLDGMSDFANTVQSHDNPEALQAYADTAGIDFEDAVAQFEDAYAGEAGRMSKRGQYDLPMGFVEDYVDSTGGAAEFLKNSQSPDSYIDRDKLVRDLQIENRYDIQEEGGETKVVDEDGEVVYEADDFDDAEAMIRQSDEELADELIDSGGLSNPDFYFDYEQLAYDMVVGGDIMVSTDDNHVFWNM